MSINFRKLRKLQMLPPERTSALRPNQAWALFWRETPTKFENIARELSQLDGIFNWTISYRRDADIWYPNGFLTDITHKNVRTQSCPEKYVSRLMSCLS